MAGFVWRRQQVAWTLVFKVEMSELRETVSEWSETTQMMLCLNESMLGVLPRDADASNVVVVSPYGE